MVRLKKIGVIFLALLLPLSPQAYSLSIWAAPDKGPVAGTYRMPVDTSSNSGPGQVSASELSAYTLGNISLTTSGSSGPATYSGGNLNIPQYSGGGGSGTVSSGTAGQVAVYGTTGNTVSGSSTLFNTTDGSGSVDSGMPLYTNGVNARSLSVGTLNGLAGSITPIDKAADMLYAITQALVVDPRYYGATCNARYFDGRNGSGTVTMNSSTPVISIGGYTFTSGDVGKKIAINNGTSGSAGIPLATILSVNTGANTATIDQQPTVNSTGGYAVMGNDDTTPFSNAANFSASFHGSFVVVPDSCTARNLVIANGVTLRGQTSATAYSYGGDIKPRMYILATGYTEDSVQLGINITGSTSVALKNFMIKGPTFPYLLFAGIKLACVGTTGGTQGTNDAILLENMSIGFCPVAVGIPYGTTPTAYIFGQSHFSEFSSNGYGLYGNFSDWTSIDDVFTSNFSGGVYEGPIGSSPGAGQMRFIGGRFEETGNAFTCDGCYNTHFEGEEFQFNQGYGLTFLNAWSEVTMTGGMMQGNGLSNSSGHQANILFNGTSAAGHFHASNVVFDKNDFAVGGDPLTQYIIEGQSSGANNPDIEITGGTAANGFSVARDIWATTKPTLYSWNTTDTPTLRTGGNTYNINKDAFSSVDFSPATTGIILPTGTTAQRPGTPTAGEMRYNTDTPGMEVYYSGTWNAITR